MSFSSNYVISYSCEDDDDEIFNFFSLERSTSFWCYVMPKIKAEVCVGVNFNYTKNQKLLILIKSNKRATKHFALAKM
jgi:hypothetical protein